VKAAGTVQLERAAIGDVVTLVTFGVALLL